ncbi:MAG: hypothetical protein WC796_01685 [Candidatus Pacearchaeota archaeon]|jgi:hypothetical protein
MIKKRGKKGEVNRDLVAWLVIGAAVVVLVGTIYILLTKRGYSIGEMLSNLFRLRR